MFSRNSLCLFQRFYCFARCIHCGLRRQNLEVGCSHLVYDLLAFNSDLLTCELAPKFCQPNAEMNLVLLREGLVEGGRCVGGELGRSPDLAVICGHRSYTRIGAEHTWLEREIKWL